MTAETLRTADASPESFAHVRDWIFDLDNTLYPRHTDLFSQIDQRMTTFVADLLSLPREDARIVQKDLYRRHGTTLRGLMNERQIDPDAFLAFVHDIDYSWLEPNAALGESIATLPGRKFIFTNGDRGHAERAARQLGVLDHFDDIFDIVASNLVPKPAAETYDLFVGRHGIDPSKAAMFEDLAKNLSVPKALSMTTVLVVPRNFETTLGEYWEHEGRDGEHIDYITDDLTTFLQSIQK
ncbi:pyrimidine 5'-nucleotidase [Fulvimarina endophytica]|uniref:Pyrimidine 5'-nucleotidase n=1 Tax=Fulvimarina endophytica TaxID=2293836 RepID=A0A371XAV4_9HYPH|nr:pyrimidine 5'-nucleotidase [Fulvimarina endophytica]RFC66174.1 pyrimidine 5'-nucleotidase [Fulvimarina endophytica]